MNLEMLCACSIMAVSAHIMLLVTAHLDEMDMGLTQVESVSKTDDGGANPSRPANHPPTKHCDDDGIASAVGACANSHGDANNA